MSEPFKLDTLVELQDQYSDVYALSPMGVRGWVRARREMPKSDPEIYIEWDTAHWRYHGEKDGWTFEHHFRMVDDAVPDYPDMSEILTEAHRKVDAERCADCGGFHDGQADFIDTLMAAQDAAAGSDAFFIITLTPKQEDENTIYEPQIFAESLTEPARCTIETQLMYIATQLFEEQMLARVNAIEQHRDELGG